MLERFLKLEGFDVRTAANGQLALQSRQADNASCVILLDLMMPVMNGWQFRQAQVRDPRPSNIPVVVVTAAGPKDEIPDILDGKRSLAALFPLRRPRGSRGV